MPSLLNEDGEFPAYFQQDGAPSHYGIFVRRWLDQQFPGSWVGRRCPIEWPPRSPDLSPLDFYLWEHLKAEVYQEKIRHMNHPKERIRNALMRISPDVLTRVHHECEKLIHMCFQSNDNHVEHFLWINWQFVKKVIQFLMYGYFWTTVYKSTPDKSSWHGACFIKHTKNFTF
jgi:hypothetical protein